jgi:hypothetical protein
MLLQNIEKFVFESTEERMKLDGLTRPKSDLREETQHKVSSVGFIVGSVVIFASNIWVTAADLGNPM